MAKTGYGRTVSNIWKGIPNDGAATEKLRDLKPVWTWGTNNKLEPEERKVRHRTKHDGIHSVNVVVN